MNRRNQTVTGQIAIVFRRELRNAAGGETGMVIMHAAIIVLWSVLFAGASAGAQPGSSTLWLLPFAVIAVSNYGQSVFVAERVSGSIEILLTCGITRTALMLGKMIFVATAAIVSGMVCLALSAVWVALAARVTGEQTQYPSGGSFVLYGCAAALATSTTALLSMYLPNPKFSHFVNFLLMACVTAAYLVCENAFGGCAAYFAAGLAVAAVAAAWGAVAAAWGERIGRPVNL